MKNKITSLVLVCALFVGVFSLTKPARAIDNCSPVVGEICLFPYASGRVLDGWLQCSGNTLNITDYPDLYAAIGSTFGGNGSTNFALPNLTNANPYSSPGGTETAAYFINASNVNSGIDILVGEVCLLPDTVAANLNNNGASLLKCDGSSYNMTIYNTLYTVIGGKFGSNVPDLSSATPLAGLSYYIAATGLYPIDSNGAEEYMGSIDLFAFSTALNNELQCNGQTVTIASNNVLFSLLGVRFGGNGITSFCIPDLRGASPLPGLTFYIRSIGYYPSFS